MWRILHNSLPVRTELNKKGVRCSILCPRCNSKTESITHIFMQCPKVARIWFGSSLTIKFPDQPNPNFIDWLYEFIIYNDESALISIASILYNIWHARNIKVYEDKDLLEEDIILRADRNIHEFLLATKPDDASASPETLRPNLRVASTRDSSWKKPKLGFLKANSDANLKIIGSSGLGGIIRNEEGLVMVSATWKSLGSNDPLLAEGYALFKTIRLAKDCGSRRMVSESDSEALIRMVKDETQSNRSYLGSLIQEIWSIQSSFDICDFAFTHRSGNKIADSLAHLAHEKPNLVWIEEVPLEAHSLYFHDLLNFFFCGVRDSN
jgi:hypothetical protein